MIRDDKQLGVPLTLFKGTTEELNNINAVEGMQAYDTTLDKYVVYDGVTWINIQNLKNSLFLTDQNLSPLGITPTTGLKFVVHNQTIWNGTNWEIFGGSTEIDLTSYIPTTDGKCKMILISIDNAGDIEITEGSEVDITTLAVTDIPSPPEGTRYVLGAIRLYYGQTQIQEARTNTDVSDLRFPQITPNHDHSGDPGSGGYLSFLGIPTEIGQIAISDGNGTATWSYLTERMRIKSIRNALSDEIYTTGINIGNLDSTKYGNEMVLGSSSDLNEAIIRGTVRCFDKDGNVLWTYISENDDYIMGIDIEDIDDDGVNEVAVGLRLKDHACILLSNSGSLLWSYDAGSGNYVRRVKIAKLRSDYPGKQVVIGGANGMLRMLDKDGSLIWTKTITGVTYDTVQSIDIADNDEDGQREIYVTCGEKVFKFDHEGNQVWQVTVGDVNTYCYALRVGNITSASGLEIAVATADIVNKVNKEVVLLDSLGTELWSYSLPYLGWSIALGDVDGDGLDEIFCGYGSHITESGFTYGEGGIVLLDGDGVKIDSMVIPSSPKSMEFKDADGDGIKELVFSCDDGHAYVVDIQVIEESVVNSDELVKISDNDTTAGYLNGKLVAGSRITLTENNDAGNETLTIESEEQSGLVIGTYLGSNEISNTTIEEQIFTGEILANTMAVGAVYRVYFFGFFSTYAASQSLTARVFVGTTEVAEIVLSPSNVTNEPFHGTVTITVREINETGRVSVYSQFYVEGEHDSLDENETIDTTVDENLKITFQWGAANAGNIVKITQGFMEVHIPTSLVGEMLVDEDGNILFDDDGDILYEE